jgi:transcriptional regulator NrdR family protein
MEQRRCVCCRQRFTLVRNSQQRYCAKPACQKKRRCQYQQSKLIRDVDYKETHQISQKKWRHAHPSYWRHYRLQHPAYVVTNRLAQRVRDKKRRDQQPNLGHDFVLANMYPLIWKNNYISNNYSIILGIKTCLQICT